MSASACLLTKSYRGDFDRAVLLFESVDTHVHGFEAHYVIVDDADHALFAPFHRGRRKILAASQFLPPWLRPMPERLAWGGRRRWWSFRARPVSGWHTQQLVKFAAAASLSEQRYCIVDSDNVFFRDFDVARHAGGEAVPLYRDPGAVGDERPLHRRWIVNGCRLLGLPRPTFPADDFIGQIIVWDQASVRALLARIEQVTRCEWTLALCRAHAFSEYMLYGLFATQNGGERHAPTGNSLCQTHWDLSTPDQQDLLTMLRASAPHQVAMCVQSFNDTPLDTIRQAIAIVVDEAERACAPKDGLRLAG